METEETVIIQQSDSNSSIIQTVLKEQNKILLSGETMWSGHPYPGGSLKFDELTLTGIKFIVSADFMELDSAITSDCGPDHGAIQINYIKYN